MAMLRVKKVRDEPSQDDGFRVLVDRVWPRGVSKRQARVKLWCMDIAPTTALRQWFGHKSERMEEFTRRYRHELEHNPAVDELLALLREHKVLTLVYGATSRTNNQAIVLARYLQEASASR